MSNPTSWLDRIEEQAYVRLRQLRQRGIWNGDPPIPLDFVVEHLLNLRICWEVIEEEPGETIFACLRPASREIVVNESHLSIFRDQPGLERFSIAHEAGHADVFALVREADQIPLFPRIPYHPQRRTATNGEVLSLHARLRAIPQPMRTEVMRGLAALEREQRAAGVDSPMERRGVDHYAAVLLMPAGEVRSAVIEAQLASRRDIAELAGLFKVSFTAMRIRLEELRLIHGVADDGRILRVDSASSDQGTLL